VAKVGYGVHMMKELPSNPAGNVNTIQIVHTVLHIGCIGTLLIPRTPPSLYPHFVLPSDHIYGLIEWGWLPR
jgi:hypothetical protein